MASTSDPLLPVQTSGMHDAERDPADPAQSETARERRFKWIRLGVLAAAGDQTPQTFVRSIWILQGFCLGRAVHFKHCIVLNQVPWAIQLKHCVDLSQVAWGR